MGKQRKLRAARSLQRNQDLALSPSKPPQPKTQHRMTRADVEQIGALVDKQTSANKNAAMLTKFKKMVERGDKKALIAYFQKYKIDADIIRLSLDTLIEEELHDLAD